MRATTRRCPGPESTRDREASAGSCSEGGKSSVAGISTHHGVIVVQMRVLFSLNELCCSSVCDDSKKVCIDYTVVSCRWTFFSCFTSLPLLLRRNVAETVSNQTKMMCYEL